MKTIIDPKKFERVISYGCSFTAGDEIVDHLILNLSFEECNKLKSKFQNQVEFERYYKIKDYPNKQLIHDHTWAGQLAKLMNLPIECRAVPGSSIDHIYFNVYHDYINDKIKQDDLVLVGITSPLRILYWNNDFDDYDSTILTSYIEKLDKKSQRDILDLNSDSIMLLKYYSTIKNLASLKNCMNIRLQHMLHDNNPNSSMFKYEVKPKAKYIIQNMQKSINDICLSDKVTLSPPDGRTYPFALYMQCGFGHASMITHKHLAIDIFNSCVQK